jgi:hypothetical protein
MAPQWFPDDQADARRGHGQDAGARREGSADKAPVRGPALAVRPGTYRGAGVVCVAPGLIHRRRYLRQASWQRIGRVLSADDLRVVRWSNRPAALRL